MSAPDIRVYSAPGCQRCRLTTRYLDKRSVPYRYVDVTTDDTALDALALLGYGVGTTLPVVVAGDVHWSDFRVAQLDALIAALSTAEDTTHLEAAAVAELTEDGAV